jgi:ribosomal protein S18 acetylase RimI-like enzyme
MTDKSPDPSSPSHILDSAVRASLLGAHARFAESVGDVLRYHPEVALFGTLPPDPSPQDWRDAAKLVGPGGTLVTAGDDVAPPAGWQRANRIPGVQMVGGNVAAAPDPRAVRLGPDDVPEILALIEHAQPGPFRTRTVEMGLFLGIRHEGRLVAMAGQRLRPPGWTEISGVCTHAAFRGRGLATRLIHAVAHDILEHGDTPFLHTGARNTTAIRLYEALGFRLRRRLLFNADTAPSGS